MAAYIAKNAHFGTIKGIKIHRVLFVRNPRWASPTRACKIF